MASNTQSIPTVHPDIPFTTFLGTLKQLRTDSLDDKQRYALDAILPSFRELDEGLTFRDWGVVNHGLGSKVLYVGRGRERRYAGDKTLARGRYFSVCNDSDGQDYGTLLSELKAYFSYRSKMPCQIYDSTVDNGAASTLAEVHYSPSSSPYILLSIGPKSPNHVVQYVKGSNHEILHLLLPLTICDMEIEKTVDLRIPDTQRWFHSTFIAIEAAFRSDKPSGWTIFASETQKRVATFLHMLPILMTTEIGGCHPFLQGVGAWLRSHGANALIYPSARTDCGTYWSVEDKMLKDWRGWNMVVYAGSGTADYEAHFGHTATWKAFVPPTYELYSHGSSLGEAGFRVEGVSEWNDRRFQRSLALAAAEAKLGFSDLFSGLFSVLDIYPDDINPMDGPGSSEGPK